MFSRIAQRSTQFIDRRVQPMLEIDERSVVAPELLTQFLARDQIAVRSQQEEQNLDGLARETDTHPPFAQLASLGIHLKRWEYKRSGRWMWCCHVLTGRTVCVSHTSAADDVLNYLLSFQ